MASFTFNPLHQKQLFSIPLCKCPSNLFKFHSSSHVLSLTSNTHSPTQTILSTLLVVRANVSQMDTKPSTAEKHSKDTISHRGGKEAGSGFSHFRSKDRSLAEKSVENDISSIVEDILETNVTKDRQIEKILDFRRRVEKGSGVFSMRSKKSVKNNVSAMVEDILEKSVKKDIPTEKRLDSRGRSEIGSGFSSMRSKKPVKNDVSAIVGDILEKSVKKDGQTEKSLDFRRRVEKGSGFSSMRSNDSSSARKISSSMGGTVVNEKMNKKFKRGNDGKLGKEKIEKSSKKGKIDLPGGDLRVGLDMCSKKGDVLGAIELYDSAQREGIKMGQYHYAVLLYLCSSAATGVVQPAKSGSSSRSLSTVESTSEISEGLGEFGELGTIELNAQFSNDCSIASGTDDLNGNSYPTSNGFSKWSPRVLDGSVHLRKNYRDSSNAKGGISGKEDKGIRVSVDLKRYALKKGFEIYEKMCLESVPMNEATLTSLARMAMSMGNGDMAFDTVKKMKELGISPRLRSYGPALSTFCNNGDIEKAFKVEEHMLENGVYPEEPELEALLRVSIESDRSDKVYYLLHKLRTSVRKVSPSIANLIEKWFESEIASRVGKRKWEKKIISEAIENGGGGWHGQGWLGKGKWNVARTSVGSDGLCKCCGEKLATIDLDPTETENFAKSVASIAIQRERNSSFQKFQKWLDYYGPFEAVVDGANVGLFSQRKFKPSKVNAVVNGIRQMLPSKKWPLIVLHNRRITGENMDKPVNEALVEKWKNADALYATPTGSNDDWYWLYAAIKFKCLMVTNDEMRDHLFQLLGNDFFPKWKERHQVRFNFSETGPVFQMPPPCSVVIQESEKGHWHIPIISEHNTEGERTWLCVTRANSHKARQASATGDEVKPQIPYQKKGHTSSDTQAETHIKLPPLYHSNREKTKYPSRDIYRNLRKALSAPVFSDHSSILPEIAAAEKFGDCVIDFQI